MHKAAAIGQLPLLKIAINKEPRDEEGQTPLHVAAKHGQLEAIQYLASVTNFVPKDKEGLFPLHVAVKHGQLDAIQYLALKKSDVELKTYNNQSPQDLAFLYNPSKAEQIVQAMAIRAGICKFTYIRKNHELFLLSY